MGAEVESETEGGEEEEEGRGGGGGGDRSGGIGREVTRSLLRQWCSR